MTIVFIRRQKHRRPVARNFGASRQTNNRSMLGIDGAYNLNLVTQMFDERNRCRNTR
jgi:hypothetical protein